MHRFCLLAAVLLLLGLAACSDDSTTEPRTIDRVETVRAVSAAVLSLRDNDRPLHDAPVLHLGHTDDSASSLLLTFDFSVFAHPDSSSLLPYLTDENIRYYELLLNVPTWYVEGDDPDNLPSSPLYEKSLVAFQCDEVITSRVHAGAEPSHGAEPVSVVSLDGPSPVGYVLQLRIDRPTALAWLESRQMVSLLVTETPDSGPGIIGVAGESLGVVSILQVMTAGSTVGPFLRLALDDELPDGRGFCILPTSFDASTWHQRPPAPGPLETGEDIDMLVDAGNLPLLRFTVPDTLPLDRLVSAELVLTPAGGSGPPTTLACHDATATMSGVVQLVLTVDEVAERTEFLDWQPAEAGVPDAPSVRFDVTGAVAHGAVALLISGYDADLVPRDHPRTYQFWHSRPRYHGTVASFALRPYLELSFWSE